MTNKFQTGGQVFFNAVANPFSDAAVADRTYSAAQSSKAATQELVPKELILELYKKGIPVDVDYVTQQLSRLEDRLNKGLPVTKTMTHSIMSKINKVLQNSKYLEDAEKYSEKNDAIGEIAVGNYYGRGQLYVLDRKNDIKSIDLAQYDPEKHGPALTINELIEHRKFNPTQAFDTSLTRIINSNIGMSKINNRIQEIIKTVGSAETTSEAYTDLVSYLGQESAKRPTRDQLATLQSMAQALQTLGPDAIFKNKQVFESKNVQDAFKYIESVLPRSEKMQLIGRYIANGGDRKNAEAYVQSLIINALNSSNNVKSGNYIDYEGTINKAAGTQAGNKEGKQVNMTGLEQLAQGTLGQRSYTIVSKNNSGLALTLKGSGLGKLTDAKNNLVNESILSDALNSGLGALIDTNNIFFGDQKISPNMLDQFIYDGNDVINIWAPVSADGGVDFSKLQKYEELRQKIKANPSLSQEDIAYLMQEIGINGTLDKNGNFVGNDPNMGQFIVLTGITSDEVIDDSENEVSYKLHGKDKDLTLEKIKQIYGVANKGLKGDARRSFKTGWFDWTTDLIAAPIFMRLGQTAQYDASTIVGNGPRITTNQYTDLVAREQARQINKPSSSLL